MSDTGIRDVLHVKSGVNAILKLVPKVRPLLRATDAKVTGVT